ncbi:bifunctional UDP-N-acetylglucosamine diphosphorylase/glucosamine-1-phosphate N-acetyltransferase GlmU [Paenibacillus sp. MMS18-CY102]|uniref:bifunctional UDP-N-acetylglucosamine diphosphorylase/glucosamine-1-phosphate N-acetyltransferase GlmU n=1 Tax=Paenibacillus sp. MMS18-CY102 TaxID=2682849 RepID=UPI0013662113|nr:bifunctional UDP-N-acetylglucosamine diphosphorylase/glucosamine-1-phosphate N-acetyltransferase GlmU [Paenibacillus sp. MMS18-CY102]MWC31127.1 bifunctional UDP-N-acetylglucosamine diphosphorylase/glucosamine-1-phosphate N-acetyltransferase GlmU [Paenibacillus sp. MMS18-CY102]
MKLIAIVLAAGQGKRMKSKLYKVLHQVSGKAMVEHVLDTVDASACERKVVVVGHGAELVKATLGDRAEFVLQSEQKGTGHAVQQAAGLVGEEEGTTVILYGDTPLVTSETIGQLLEKHNGAKAAATVLTAIVPNPQGLGRIIRGENGQVLRIVEQKDCSPEEAAIDEINTGMYCFDNRKLFEALKLVKNDNAQGEFYLTDVLEILRVAGETVEAHIAADFAEGIGVNDRVGLAEAEQLMRARIVRKHQINGVTIIDPAATYIEAGVVIGADTIIYPGTVLRGNTVIGEDCVIGPQADLTNVTLGNGVSVKYSVAVDSVVGDDSAVGPYANLRPGSKLGKECKIGDFVELKNATLGDGSKVSHLSYVGDAVVGKDVNIGCGAITVNYDGFNKSITEIGDNAFVGSNVNLIAPVKIGNGAYVVAGSTITQDVPGGDLAIARERQVNKPGYADKIRSRAKSKKERLNKQ